jgi:O-antigen/teichoic acid export membrane protein
MGFERALLHFMSVKRILKLMTASLTGQGVSVINQLLIPPLFFHCYDHGIERYGEWIALSAAISYLNTVNGGIQNYANNQMTIHYNRGEVDTARAVQASALILSLSLFAIVAIADSTLLFLPVGRWLSLRYTASAAASQTMVLLILSLIISWLFAILANSFMAVGKLHRGANWTNAQRLFSTVLIAALLWGRASFPVLALGQCISIILFTVLVAIDLRTTAPILLPSLRYGSVAVIRSLIRPSALFMLYSVSGFLLWQGPVLIVQKILGPASLAIFSLTRIVFNMGRQLLIVVTNAIGQEITILIGSRDWMRLHRLYELSERVVLSLVTTVSVGTLLFCPFLLTVWLHKRSVYDPTLCLLMAIISAVMAIKEHKTQFQWSSNQHQRFSVSSLLAYLVMCALSTVMLPRYGMTSLMVLWLCAETVQVFYLLKLNRRLFPPEAHVSAVPVVRSAAVLAVCFGLSIWPVYSSVNWPLTTTVLIATAATAFLAVLSYYFFGLRELLGRFTAQLTQRPA